MILKRKVSSLVFHFASIGYENLTSLREKTGEGRIGLVARVPAFQSIGPRIKPRCTQLEIFWGLKIACSVKLLVCRAEGAKIWRFKFWFLLSDSCIVRFRSRPLQVAQCSCWAAELGKSSTLPAFWESGERPGDALSVA